MLALEQLTDSAQSKESVESFESVESNRMLKNSFSLRLLKKIQLQGGARCEVRGVLSAYAAAPRERDNAADGPFSAAC